MAIDKRIINKIQQKYKFDRNPLLKFLFNEIGIGK